MAKLYFHYSSMNAGKTTQLLQVAHNYQERKLPILLLKPAFDNREGSAVIASRIGIEKPCVLFHPDDNLHALIRTYTESSPVHCVLIDEAQFLTPQQVWQLSDVVDVLNIPVMTYGLRVDFQSRLFPGSAELMAISDVLREIRTVDESGVNATMVVRLDGMGNAITEGPQNQIGGNESYRAVSRKEWKRLVGK